MSIIEQNAIYYIKSKKVDDDVKKLIDVFYADLRNLFSDVRMGVNALVLSNNFLSYLLRWNFIDLISWAEIIVEPKKNYFVLTSKVSFSRWVIVNSAIILIIFFSMLLASDALFITLLFSSILVAIIFIFQQISAIRFNSKVVDCIRKSGLEIN